MMKFRSGTSLSRASGSIFTSAPQTCKAGPAPNSNTRITAMMDLVLIGTGILFFALSVAYVKACDAL